MNMLKSISASALHLVPHAQQDEPLHIEQKSQIEQKQAMTQDLQINPTQQLGFDKTVGLGSIPQDREIESPAHYTAGRTIEPINAIEDWNLNHHLACALKYIARAGRKHDEVKDLRKAVWYLSRRIKLLEQQE